MNYKALVRVLDSDAIRADVVERIAEAGIASGVLSFTREFVTMDGEPRMVNGRSELRDAGVRIVRYTDAERGAALARIKELGYEVGREWTSNGSGRKVVWYRVVRDRDEDANGFLTWL